MKQFVSIVLAFVILFSIGSFAIAEDYEFISEPKEFVIELLDTDAVKINIWTDQDNNPHLHTGDTITFYSEVTGIPDYFDGIVLYQWQYSKDCVVWNNIENATSDSFSEVIDLQNANYYYRVIVHII